MSKIKFRPLHDRVVVKRILAEEKTKGGIIIPDSATEKPQEGEVVAAGPGGRDDAGKLPPLGIKTADQERVGTRPGPDAASRPTGTAGRSPGCAGSFFGAAPSPGAGEASLMQSPAAAFRSPGGKRIDAGSQPPVP